MAPSLFRSALPGDKHEDAVVAPLQIRAAAAPLWIRTTVVVLLALGAGRERRGPGEHGLAQRTLLGTYQR